MRASMRAEGARSGSRARRRRRARPRRSRRRRHQLQPGRKHPTILAAQRRSQRHQLRPDRRSPTVLAAQRRSQRHQPQPDRKHPTVLAAQRRSQRHQPQPDRLGFVVRWGSIVVRRRSSTLSVGRGLTPHAVARARALGIRPERLLDPSSAARPDCVSAGRPTDHPTLEPTVSTDRRPMAPMSGRGGGPPRWAPARPVAGRTDANRFRDRSSAPLWSHHDGSRCWAGRGAPVRDERTSATAGAVLCRRAAPIRARCPCPACCG